MHLTPLRVLEIPSVLRGARTHAVGRRCAGPYEIRGFGFGDTFWGGDDFEVLLLHLTSFQTLFVTKHEDKRVYFEHTFVVSRVKLPMNTKTLLSYKNLVIMATRRA